MTTYDIVKEKADAAGKSIASLEVEAGIANGTIGGWRKSRPYAETLQKVAVVLQCKIEDLIGEQS